MPRWGSAELQVPLLTEGMRTDFSPTMKLTAAYRPPRCVKMHDARTQASDALLMPLCLFSEWFTGMRSQGIYLHFFCSGKVNIHFKGLADKLHSRRN